MVEYPAPLRCTHVDDDGTVSLAVSGELTVAGAWSLTGSITNALAELPAGVVVDLAAVVVPPGAPPAAVVSAVAGPATEVAGGGSAVDSDHSRVPVMFVCPPGPLAEHLVTELPGRVFPTVPAARVSLAAIGSRYRRATRLAGTADAPARGRQFVARICREWRLADLIPAAQMIVSELCSNAVRHVGDGLRVVVARTDGFLHIMVRDLDGRPLVRPGHPAADQPDGRGLWLVETFAAAWGVDRTCDGKAVWATLRIAHPTW